MMAKITKGASFSGAVKYILDPKKQAELIGADGLRLKDLNTIAQNFETQSRLNPRVGKPVGHISLDFSVQDRDKLDNITMLSYALEYMKCMGITDTQFIIGRHHDRDHPHIHILYNRVNNNGRTISDQNDRIRSTKICRELTEKYGLYLSSGKENVKRERLREPDATKYRIYDALCKHVPCSKSWAELQNRLQTEGIELAFKTKGSTTQVEGVRFTMNNISFNGSKVDRQFSYSKIDFALKQNQCTEEQRIEPQPTREAAHSVAEQLSSITGGLFDIPLEPHGDDPEEERFRRQMQRKNKKKGRRM